MIETDGKWHSQLNALRQQLRRGMSGDVADSMRAGGVEYGINFGVKLPYLQELLHELPQEKELAQLMWQKNVREMKLLAIMLLERCCSATESEVHTMVAEVPTLEVLEQLVLRLVAPAEWAPRMAVQLWEEQLAPSTLQAIAPYIIFTRLAMERRVSAPLMERIAVASLHHLSSAPTNPLQTYILRALSRAAECQPELRGSLSDMATQMLQATANSPTYLIGAELKSLIEFLEEEE